LRRARWIFIAVLFFYVSRDVYVVGAGFEHIRTGIIPVALGGYGLARDFYNGLVRIVVY
jgi:uncharacterized membrane protein